MPSGGLGKASGPLEMLIKSLCVWKGGPVYTFLLALSNSEEEHMNVQKASDAMNRSIISYLQALS